MISSEANFSWTEILVAVVRSVSILVTRKALFALKELIFTVVPFTDTLSPSLKPSASMSSREIGAA